MKQGVFWISLLLMSLVAGFFFEWGDGGLGGDIWLDVLPSIVGRATALILIPALLVSGIVFVRKSFRRPTSHAAIFTIASIVWIVLLISVLRAFTTESALTTSPSFDFSPDGCEYTVSFPAAPRSYTQEKMTLGGQVLPLYGAELVLDRGSGLIRAECVQAAGLTNPGPDYFVPLMKEIASDLGLLRPSFETQEGALGTMGTITGVKDTERGRITVRVINVVGDSSILTLYLTALSSDFQTQEMRPFVQSVRRK